MFHNSEHVDILDEGELFTLYSFEQDFIVYISSQNGYFRPMYGAKPVMGHVCGFIHHQKHASPVAYICQIEAIAHEFDNRVDDEPKETYALRELKQDGFSQLSTNRWHDVDAQDIPCLFKRMDSRLVESYIEKKWREENDPYFHGGD